MWEGELRHVCGLIGAPGREPLPCEAEAPSLCLLPLLGGSFCLSVCLSVNALLFL